MNILVTGANGQLGNEMRIVSRSSSDRYIFTDVNQIEGLETTFLDITDLEAIRAIVAQHHIDAIVNCAAYTNVDAAEDPANAAIVEALNATAPQNLALAMKEVNGLMVQISTDYVFGQEPYNVPCREDQKGTPTGVYGMSKLHGEQNILASGVKHIIIRTAWLYSEFGKNFCKTMLNLTATKPALKVVFDQTGTPTYAYDLALAIATILDDYRSEGTCGATYSKQGVYHYSNEGVCSWFDFTKMIQQIAVSLETPETLKPSAPWPSHGLCDVQPCHSNEFPSPVTRPSYSVLDKTKIKEVFGVKVPYWTDSLATCIRNLKGQG